MHVHSQCRGPDELTSEAAIQLKTPDMSYSKIVVSIEMAVYNAYECKRRYIATQAMPLMSEDSTLRYQLRRKCEGSSLHGRVSRRANHAGPSNAWVALVGSDWLVCGRL